MNTVKEMVKDKKKIKFVLYRKGELWYITECGFQFPVPISDTGDASFKAEDDALYYMRWISKYRKELTKSMEETENFTTKVEELFAYMNGTQLSGSDPSVTTEEIAKNIGNSYSS